MIRELSRRHFLWQISVVLGFVTTHSGLVFGARDAPVRRTPSGDLLETVPKGALPLFAKKAGPKAQKAYRFAADHPGRLQYIPCFCGCRNIGHRHNGDCYVAERLPRGRITFTSHGST